MTQKSELKSGWEFYSLAKAAHNKPLGEHDCEVILLELSNFFDGEINARGERSDVEFEDDTGKKHSSSVVTSQSVTATWKCDESNRITPPDVRRDEELLIFRFADTGKLFWTTRNTNRFVRKLETVTYAFSGTTDETDDTVTDKNHYLLEVSTHTGHIAISTSDANGEKCRWFIQARGSDGKFIVADNDNNEFLIDSVNRLIRFINGDDTQVELNRKNIKISHGGNYDSNTLGNYTINVGGNAVINVKGNTTLTTAAYTVNAQQTTFNGKVMCNSTFEVKGTSQLNGHVSMPGGHSPPD